ncbi:hypothetical protein GQ85_19865 [Rhodococcus rhodochrous]|nr:hypothetical protein GQ85_19865 [Rhodococcus rhodochrous]
MHAQSTNLADGFVPVSADDLADTLDTLLDFHGLRGLWSLIRYGANLGYRVEVHVDHRFRGVTQASGYDLFVIRTDDHDRPADALAEAVALVTAAAPSFEHVAVTA